MAADPRHADFGISALHQVRCVDADLRGARLVRADLREADFSRADLREANLRKARAHDAVFAGADLRMADLRGCDPRGADLRQAALEGALASDRTSWPHGFDLERPASSSAPIPAPNRTTCCRPPRSPGRPRLCSRP